MSAPPPPSRRVSPSRAALALLCCLALAWLVAKRIGGGGAGGGGGGEPGSGPASQAAAESSVTPERRRGLPPAPGAPGPSPARIELPEVASDPADDLATASGAALLAASREGAATPAAGAAGGSCVLVGRLVTGAGDPVEGATVRVALDSPEAPDLSTAAVAGEFVLEIPATPGEVFVVIDAPECAARALRLRVRGPGIFDAGEVRLERIDGRERLSLVITTEPPGGDAFLEGPEGPLTVVRGAATEAWDLAPGPYRVEAVSGDLSLMGGVDVTIPPGPGPLEVVVPLEPARDVCSVEGVVEAPGDAAVTIELADVVRCALGDAPVRVEAQGGAFAARLPPGRYEVRVVSAEVEAPPVDLEARPGATARLSIRTRPVAAAPAPAGDAPGDAPALREDGPPDARLRIVGARPGDAGPGSFMLALRDEAGRVLESSLPSGDEPIEVYAGTLEVTVHESAGAATVVRSLGSLRLAPGATGTLDVSAPRGAIEGEAPPLAVSAPLLAVGRGVVARAFCERETGRFRLEGLPAGAYRLYARFARGPVDVSVGAGETVEVAIPGMRE